MLLQKHIHFYLYIKYKNQQPIQISFLIQKNFDYQNYFIIIFSYFCQASIFLELNIFFLLYLKIILNQNQKKIINAALFLSDQNQYLNLSKKYQIQYYQNKKNILSQMQKLKEVNWL
ncbi:hypothetical protein ABPG72_002066 [Tetrahymena utriculariae]